MRKIEIKSKTNEDCRENNTNTETKNIFSNIFWLHPTISQLSCYHLSPNPHSLWPSFSSTFTVAPSSSIVRKAARGSIRAQASVVRLMNYHNQWETQNGISVRHLGKWWPCPRLGGDGRGRQRQMRERRTRHACHFPFVHLGKHEWVNTRREYTLSLGLYNARHLDENWHF